MNPILRKEIRGLLRERRGWLVPMIYALVLAAMASMLLLEAHDEERNVGPGFAGIVAVVQALTVGLVGAQLGGAAIADERERGTWTRLLSAPIARWRIVAGKLAAISLYVVMLLLVSLPIASLSLLRGGTDVAALAGLYVTHAVMGITLACIGVAVSSLFHRTWAAVLTSTALTLGLVIFTLFASMILSDHLSRPTALSDAVLCCNPGYGLFLFFSGDSDRVSGMHWAGHYAAMAAIAGLAIAFACSRLRAMCD